MTTPEDTELRDAILAILIEEYKQDCNYDALVRLENLITLHTQKAKKDALMGLHGYLSISKWSSDNKSYEKGMNDRLEDIMQTIKREVKSMGKQL